MKKAIEALQGTIQTYTESIVHTQQRMAGYKIQVAACQDSIAESNQAIIDCNQALKELRR